MILSSTKQSSMAYTPLLLTEPTSPLLPGLVCVNLISQRDAVAYRAGGLLPGSHCGCVVKLYRHSASDGHTRDLDRTLGPGEGRGQLLEALQ